MKLTLAFLGLAMAAAASSVKADDLSGLSDDELVMLAVASTNQTDGPSAWDWPNMEAAEAEIAVNTSATTVDVVIPEADDAEKRSVKELYNLGNVIAKRDEFRTLTDGTDPLYSNAALQAPSYLTYTVISNTTTAAVAKASCLAYCDSVKGCVAANMYNEINNPLLDHV
jgi:hypothetical protein